MKKRWKWLHYLIVFNFLLEIIYGFYQVFIINSYGGVGVLFRSSSSMPREDMVVRRLYAIETWIAIAGLSIYLAIVYRDQLKFQGINKEKSEEDKN